jgi:hypothetical protein
MNYDVFNGDADGIIALIQLRLADPREAVLITGVKRDIELLTRLLEPGPKDGGKPVQAGDKVTVLDISLTSNRAALEEILACGASVTYVDHHACGERPTHSRLHSHIDPDADTCTSLIVNALLGGQFQLWAITAAYGDNLTTKADAMAQDAGLTLEQAAQLRELGTLINYNGYGSSIADLHYRPDELYLRLCRYPSPFEAIADASSPFPRLQLAYQTDLALASAIAPLHVGKAFTLVRLPNEAWARRVSGVFANRLANENPSRAIGVLTQNLDGSLTFSLRAPLNNKQGAADICARFPSGGGREAAAGINSLLPEQLDSLIERVEEYYRAQF